MMKFNAALAVSVFMLAGCSTLQKKPASAPVPAPTAAAAPAPVSKVAEKEVSGAEIACENGGDKRTLTVVQKNPGCELHYFKGGKSVVVATSMNHPEFCDEVQERIKKRLIDSQFACK